MPSGRAYTDGAESCSADTTKPTAFVSSIMAHKAECPTTFQARETKYAQLKIKICPTSRLTEYFSNKI